MSPGAASATATASRRCAREEVDLPDRARRFDAGGIDIQDRLIRLFGAAEVAVLKLLAGLGQLRIHFRS